MKKVLFYFIFLVTYSANNNPFYSQSAGLDWVKSFGDAYSDFGSSITVDSSGNVYTIGSFQGTIDFDPGTGVSNLTSSGDIDVFLSKLDANGNFLWAVSIGGVNEDRGYAVILDIFGNVCITGSFRETVDFDPGTGINNLTSAGSNDIFISKFDVNGNFLWAISIGGTDDDFGNSIAADASGNIYTTGYFNGIVDFDPGSGIYNLASTGGTSIFFSKVDENGNFLWGKKLSGPSQDVGNAIALDTSGNVYTTGYFNGTVDFDPGTGTSTLTAVALSYDTFILKLDMNGNFLWAKSFGGDDLVIGKSITIDPFGKIYTIGSFGGTADFDPGTGVNSLTSISSGSYDLFISKLDENGNFLWAKNMGGTAGPLVGECVASDASGNVYSTGCFFGTIDFDPGTEIHNLTQIGSYDMFITKFDGNGNFLWAKSIGGSGWDTGSSIAVDESENIYTTGPFPVTVDFDPGVGISNLTSVGSYDAFILKLKPCQPVYITDSITSCGSYTWMNGIEYDSSTNTPSLTFESSTNCDSVITLNLMILPLATSDVFETVCGSFTWTNGNGQIYNTSTITTHTISNGAVNGCDSIVTLNLTVTDTTVSVNGIELTANQINATSYQWIDCDNTNAPIVGATTQVFTPTTNGNYAVVITANGCSATSACIPVTTVGLESLDQSNWKVYPNPANEKLVVEVRENMNVEIMDVFGKVIHSESLKSGSNIIHLNKLTPGVYFIVSDSAAVVIFLKQ